MARAAIVVGSEVFTTQKALRERLQGIRDRCPTGGTVTGEDAAFMHEVIKRHHGWEERFSPGVDHFTVDLDGWARGNRCFFVVTTNGEHVSFAVDACVEAKAKKPGDYARSAARHSTYTQTAAFRDRALLSGEGCAECGAILDRNGCHVDHVAPNTFEALWQNFMAANPELDFSAIPARTRRVGEERFKSRETELRWCSFHLMHANLELVCKRCNLSTRRKQASALRDSPAAPTS